MTHTTITHMRHNVVERVRLDPNLLTPRRPAIRSTPFVLSFCVTFKSELMDIVTKVVMVAVLEVRNKILNVASVGDERATRGEVEVSSDLVDADAPSHRAALRVLLVNFGSPVFSDALRIEVLFRFEIRLNEIANLFDSIWVAEAPATVQVRLTNALASLAASTLRRLASVARTTIAIRTRFNSLLNVVVKFIVVETVVNDLSVGIKAGLDHIVRQVLKDLAGNIRNVQGKH